MAIEQVAEIMGFTESEVEATLAATAKPIVEPSES
jgi:hypothetical protein